MRHFLLGVGVVERDCCVSLYLVHIILPHFGQGTYVFYFYVVMDVFVCVVITTFIFGCSRLDGCKDNDIYIHSSFSFSDPSSVNTKPKDNQNYNNIVKRYQNTKYPAACCTIHRTYDKQHIT